jgi:hypothetical protein
MAKRFFASAFIVCACVLLAPIGAQARSGGISAGPGAGSGFRGLPAAGRHGAPRGSFGHRGAPRASFGHRVAPRVNVGPFDIRRHAVGRPGIRHPLHRLGGRHHRGGYAVGTYPVDAFSYGSVTGYPYPVAVAPPDGAEPIEAGAGIGGPLLLRHVCRSEVQIVPATGGGDHEVTVTRCRLFAEYPGQ